MKPDLARMLSNIPLFTALRRNSKSSAQQPGTGPIEEIGWDEFEQLVTEGFVRRGYHAPGGRSAASGGDLLLRRERETYLVYCRAWQNKKVGLSAVKTLQQAMQARGANGGFLVTFGRIGREATRMASAERIQLLDGTALKNMLEPIRAARRTAVAEPAVTTPAVRRAVPESPSCPLCGKAMRMRTAKRGSHAGHGFWGCIAHPDCKGLRPLV
ncbi:MAG TPA: restriction endonuclease [Burkholderiaceae bacterium]